MFSSCDLKNEFLVDSSVSSDDFMHSHIGEGTKSLQKQWIDQHFIGIGSVVIVEWGDTVKLTEDGIFKSKQAGDG